MNNCRSQDPYCGNAPPPYGSYEAYAPELCGDCIDAEIEARMGFCEVCNDKDELEDGLCRSCIALREGAVFA